MGPRNWRAGLERAPLGVLVLGGVLGFLGGGFLLGGAYLAISRRDAGWMGWLAALVLGPLVLYFALHLVRLSRWTWMAMLLLLGLLLFSSVIRAVLAPDFPLASLAELVVEGLALAYLLRARIRRAFGWR